MTSGRIVGLLPDASQLSGNGVWDTHDTRSLPEILWGAFDREFSGVEDLKASLRERPREHSAAPAARAAATHGPIGRSEFPLLVTSSGEEPPHHLSP